VKIAVPFPSNQLDNTNNNTDNSDLPFVSICTVTYNRRPFIPIIIKCVENQTYPKDRIEWVIVDDGKDKIKDLVKDIPYVKYIKLDVKLKLGEKRNFANEQCSGDIIVYMDDDDYYPPERIAHAVEKLIEHPDILIAGCDIINVYYFDIDKILQHGPIHVNHATAATFAFKKELLNTCKYDDDSVLGEETVFLKKYTVPIIQLDSKKTIFVLSHEQNTFDKKLARGQSTVHETDYKINDFIIEKDLINWYKNNMVDELQSYEVGKLKYKPDVLNELERIKDIYGTVGGLQVFLTTNGISRALTRDEIIINLEKLLTENKLLISQNKELQKKINIIHSLTSSYKPRGENNK